MAFKITPNDTPIGTDLPGNAPAIASKIDNDLLFPGTVSGYDYDATTLNIAEITNAYYQAGTSNQFNYLDYGYTGNGRIKRVAFGEYYWYVGEPGDDTRGTDQGRVRIFDYEGNHIRDIDLPNPDATQRTYLTGQTNARFGLSLAYSGGRLVVGSPFFVNDGSIIDTYGNYWLFEYDGTYVGHNGYISSQVYFSDSEGFSTNFISNLATLGFNIAGADGLFAFAKVPSDNVTGNGNDGTDGRHDTVIITDTDLKTIWFACDDPALPRAYDYGEQYGYSLAVGNNRVIIGSPLLGSATQPFLGRVDVYDYNGNIIERITCPSPGSTSPFFGGNVNVGNSRIAISAQWRDNNSGSVYLYDLDCNLITRIDHPDGGTGGQNQFFGRDVHIGNGRIFIHSMMHLSSSVYPQIHVYDLNGNFITTWSSDDTDFNIDTSAQSISASNTWGSVGIGGYKDKFAIVSANYLQLFNLGTAAQYFGIGQNDTSSPTASTGKLYAPSGYRYQSTIFDAAEQGFYAWHNGRYDGTTSNAACVYDLPGTSTSNTYDMIRYTTSTSGGPSFKIGNGWWNAGSGASSEGTVQSTILATNGNDARYGRWAKGDMSGTAGWYVRATVAAGSQDSTLESFTNSINAWHKIVNHQTYSQPQFRKFEFGSCTYRVDISTYAGTGGIVCTGYFKTEKINSSAPAYTLTGSSSAPGRLFGLTAGTDIIIGWEFRTNGEIWGIGSASGDQQLGTWATSTGLSTNTWIRFTQNTSDGLGTSAPDASYSDSLNTWHQIINTAGGSTMRKVKWNPPANTFAGGSIKVEISNSSGGSPIEETGYYGIEVESGQ